MARRAKLGLAVGLVLIAVPAGRWVRHTLRWQSPTERAHRLCRECGLDDDQINRLIDTKRDAGLTREEELNLLYAPFGDRAEAEPCAEAVLDAADSPEWP